MNAIQVLEQRVRQRFPSAKVSLDPAEKPTGSWFLDLDLEGYPMTIEWRPRAGFGIVAKRESGYGEGVDVVLPDLESAVRRVFGLLLAKSKTSPPSTVRLRELRAFRGLSQVELAKSLRVNQAAVSKLEQRTDLRLATLRQVVRALGGELEIRARFPDSTFELDIGETASTDSSRKTRTKQPVRAKSKGSRRRA